MSKILVIFAKFVWENRGKSKKIPTINFPATLLPTKVFKKSETLVCDYSVEVLFELLISKHHLFYVLNGITLKSAIFAVNSLLVGDFRETVNTLIHRGLASLWFGTEFKI